MPIDIVEGAVGRPIRKMTIHNFDMAGGILRSRSDSAFVNKAIEEAGDIDTAVGIMKTKFGKVRAPVAPAIYLSKHVVARLRTADSGPIGSPG
jgi:hypothetical protein